MIRNWRVAFEGRQSGRHARPFHVTVELSTDGRMIEQERCDHASPHDVSPDEDWRPPICLRWTDRTPMPPPTFRWIAIQVMADLGRVDVILVDQTALTLS